MISGSIILFLEMYCTEASQSISRLLKDVEVANKEEKERNKMEAKQKLLLKWKDKLLTSTKIE